MDEVYVVIDWDAEEIVGVDGRQQGAELIKADYCTKRGMADEDNARSRVTLELIRVSDQD